MSYQEIDHMNLNRCKQTLADFIFGCTLLIPEPAKCVNFLGSLTMMFSLSNRTAFFDVFAIDWKTQYSVCK